MRVMPECARANIRGPKTRKVALSGLRRSDCRPGPDDGDWSRAWRARLFRPQHQLQLSLSLSRTPRSLAPPLGWNAIPAPARRAIIHADRACETARYFRYLQSNSLHLAYFPPRIAFS